jgi:hypothetical protein
MPRKKQQQQTSFPINFSAMQTAMTALKTAAPTHFDLRRVSPKLIELIAPAIFDGFADEQIINALTAKAAGSPEAMMALVAAVRQALEIAQIGEGGDVCKVANTALPSHQMSAAGVAQVVGGTTKRRSAPKTPSPTAALQPPEAPVAEANSGPSILGSTKLAAEADATDAMIVVAAAPPIEAAPLMSSSSPTADGGGTRPVDGAVAAPKSTSETQTTPGAADRVIDAAAAPPPKAAPSATPSPPTGDRYKAAASDAAAPRSAPKPGHDQTRLEFPPTDRFAPQSEKS